MAADLVNVHFQVPRAWRDQLREAAETQAISVGDLLRIIVRGFLRGQLTEAERAVLS